MAEPVSIKADPISSDGSEESWILLDEMDEAMNEELNSPQISSEVPEDQASSTDTLHEVNEIEVATEAVVMPSSGVTVDYPSNVDTMSSEAISACPSNDEDDNDVNETADSRRLDLHFIT